jgi:hypothetical protein
MDEQIAFAKSLFGAIMPDGKIYNPYTHRSIVDIRNVVGLDDGNKQIFPDERNIFKKNSRTIKRRIVEDDKAVRRHIRRARRRAG